MFSSRHRIDRTVGIRLTLGTLAAALTVALTGCVPPSSTFLEPAPVVEATPSVIAEPLPGDTNGDGRISIFEQQVLDQNAPRDYVMPDGTVVGVDPTLPLPVEVVDVIRDGTAAAIPGFYTNPQVGFEGVSTNLDTQSAATGKTIVIVYFIPTTSDGNGWAAMQSNNSGTIMQSRATKEEAVAFATTYAANRDAELIIVG